MNNPEHFFSQWFGKLGATPESISSSEAACDIHFPDDYKEFLCCSNGGEGRIGRLYITLWPAEDLYKLNERQGIIKDIRAVVGFATDGPDFYGFNKSCGPLTIVRIPLGDFRPEMWQMVADSFTELLNKMRDGKIY